MFTVDMQGGIRKDHRLPWIAEGFQAFDFSMYLGRACISELSMYITLLENVERDRATEALNNMYPIVVADASLHLPNVHSVSSFEAGIILGLKQDLDIMIINSMEHFHEFHQYVDTIHLREIPKTYDCDIIADEQLLIIENDFEVTGETTNDQGVIFKVLNRKWSLKKR